MNKLIQKTLAMGAALSLAACSAMADSVSFNGTVIASHTAEVYAPIGGTVEKVCVKAGQQVTEDTVLCTLKTNKVYASKSGTVTGVFGAEGDLADDISAGYGGVLYIQPDKLYTVNASTEDAYSSAETRFVNVGEHVYLATRGSSRYKGEGTITSVNGTAYMIEVTDGSFRMDDSVDVYREATCKPGSRIGRGTVGRSNPVAVASSGSIVSVAVKNGDTVQRGDLLFETLNGSYDGAVMPGTDIKAGVSGVISQLSTQQGSPITKDGVVAVIYPSDSMQIRGSVYESNLADISVGEPVEIEMNWNDDTGIKYNGTVSMISSAADSDAMGNVSYTVYVDFTPDADTRFGMSVVVSTIDDDPKTEADADDDDFEDEDEDEEAAEEAETQRPGRGNRPEGMPPRQ